MKIESGDIIALTVSKRTYRSKVSKIDGNIVKLLEEDGGYRQIPVKNLHKLVERGLAKVEKSNINKI